MELTKSELFTSNLVVDKLNELYSQNPTMMQMMFGTRFYLVGDLDIYGDGTVGFICLLNTLLEEAGLPKVTINVEENVLKGFSEYVE